MAVIDAGCVVRSFFEFRNDTWARYYEDGAHVQGLEEDKGKASIVILH